MTTPIQVQQLGNPISIINMLVYLVYSPVLHRLRYRHTNKEMGSIADKALNNLKQ